MACVYMFEYIRNNLFIPGQVENWLILMDLEFMGLLNVPYKVRALAMLLALEPQGLLGCLDESVPLHISQSLHSQRDGPL